MSVIKHGISSSDARAVQSMRAMFAGAPKLKFEPASHPVSVTQALPSRHRKS